ncbi:MAG: TldD protein [Frankiales bacterium]|nr:TldD protein [Frankiales bacterium]MDX6221978.1 TldD protein [Frankiales bacterium]
MLDESDVTAVLSAALTSGADWAEVYAEKRDSTSIRVEDRRVEELTSTRSQGVGVRVVKGVQSAYAYTNVLTRESMLSAAKAAAAGVSGAQSLTVLDLTRVEPPVLHPALVSPALAAKQAKVDIARRAEESAWSQGGEVVQVMVSYADVAQRVFIANSFGHLSDTTRVRTRLAAQVVASRGDLTQTGFDGPGASKGMEHYDEFPPEGVGERAAQQALRLLDSVPSPAGEMTVVLNAGGGGVLFHEACGHGLEADAIGKDTTVYARTRGDKVGSELFSGVDDPTVVGSWGSYGFDDEGTAASRTTLFDRGVQAGVMSDRISAHRLGTVSTGHGRRQSYAHVPLPRMSNSLVLPGTSDPASLVSDVKSGLFCAELGGGEVNPATGDFVFGVTEGYLIENGELTARVRGANIIGNGPRALAQVDGVGSDFALKQGMCGKGGQWVPVAFGTPTLRIATLTVGGLA